jgi:hypothetical protein
VVLAELLRRDHPVDGAVDQELLDRLDGSFFGAPGGSFRPHAVTGVMAARAGAILFVGG